MEAIETYIVTSEIDNGGLLLLDENTKYNVTDSTIVNNKNYLAINDLVDLKGSRPTGIEDYITLDGKKSVDEGRLTINGYIIIIKEGKIISTSKTKNIKIDSITLNYLNQTMEKGSTFTLKAIFAPVDASNQSVTYKSSDESIVTVDEKGIVKAVGKGIAKIIVTSKEYKNKKAECSIEVILPVERLVLDKETAEILIGEKIQLSANYLSSNPINGALEWTSSDNSIAYVDSNGLVTGISAGETIITAKTIGGIKATSKITVKTVEAESIELNKTSENMEIGDTLTLIPTILPVNATNKTVIWTSSDPSVATVENGVITAIDVGSAIITAETIEGIKASTKITVKTVEAESIELNKTSENMKIGDTLTLIPTILPANTTNKTVIWTSSDPSVATVENGVITAIGVGSAIITAETSNGKMAAVIITIKGYLADAVKKGDYVAYDAGKWPSSTNLPSSTCSKTNKTSNSTCFGGYTEGKNRGESVAKCYSGNVTLKGWRVLTVNKTSKVVTLVHAGHPECFYHKTGGYQSQSLAAFSDRALKIYLNSDYATGAHIMNSGEAKAITGSTANTTNDLRTIGDKYYLATKYGSYCLTAINSNGGGFINEQNMVEGIRPVIVLKACLKTSGKGTDYVGQSGAWILDNSEC